MIARRNRVKNRSVRFVHEDFEHGCNAASAASAIKSAFPLAGVMELVDVPDSKSGARNGVGVRVPPPAPNSGHL